MTDEHDHDPGPGPGRLHERGAALVEYALLLALIALVCIVAVTTLGQNLERSYDSTSQSVVAAN